MTRVLLVDDSRAMRMLIRRALRQAGVDGDAITEAGSGSEALQVIIEKAPDLVISDWNMPDMLGIELLETLNERRIKVRMGFITSERSPAMRERAALAGAAFFIVKPFPAEALQAILQPAGAR